jgi:hypothetical protein
MEEIVERQDVCIVINIKADIFKDISCCLSPSVSLRNNMMIFLSEPAVATCIVNEESGFTDEVVVIFVERLRSRFTYCSGTETLVKFAPFQTRRTSGKLGPVPNRMR